MKRVGKIVRTYAALAATVSAGLAALVVACSSSSSSTPAQCNTDPWQCSAGETCWVKDCVCPSGQCDLNSCVPQFACMKSIAGKQVDSLCAITVGDPTCGDQQTCVELMAGNGHCASFCDAQHPCPSGSTCSELGVGGAGNVTVHACMKIPQDGGPQPDAGASDGASDASGDDVQIIPTIDSGRPM